MRDEKYARQTLNAICSAYCDHVDDAVYSKERPNPLAGRRPGGWSMIGRRGFPTLEPPYALAGSARPAPVSWTCHRMRIASRQGPRAPPGEGQTPDYGPSIRDGSRYRLQIWRWASGGAASPGKPSSTRIERSQFMTTQITSACSQCKGSVGRPSCGIAPAGPVRRAVRRRGAYP